MREIKFREWDPVREEMYADSDNSVHFGMSYSTRIEYDNSTGFVFRHEEDIDHEFRDKKIVDVHGEPTRKLMQYTGVKDVNGKEVFEGDIVSEHYQRIEGPNYDPVSFGFIDNDFEIDATLIGKVVIWPSTGVMINKIITPDDWQFDKEHVVPTKFHVTKGCEVLGNIYENPELLEGE